MPSFSPFLALYVSSPVATTLATAEPESIRVPAYIQLFLSPFDLGSEPLCFATGVGSSVKRLSSTVSPVHSSICASAGTISPPWTIIISSGTSIAAGISSSDESRITLYFILADIVRFLILSLLLRQITHSVIICATDIARHIIPVAYCDNAAICIIPAAKSRTAVGSKR